MKSLLLHLAGCSTVGCPSDERSEGQVSVLLVAEAVTKARATRLLWLLHFDHMDEHDKEGDVTVVRGVVRPDDARIPMESAAREERQQETRIEAAKQKIKQHAQRAKTAVRWHTYYHSEHTGADTHASQ